MNSYKKKNKLSKNLFLKQTTCYAKKDGEIGPEQEFHYQKDNSKFMIQSFNKDDRRQKKLKETEKTINQKKSLLMNQLLKILEIYL